MLVAICAYSMANSVYLAHAVVCELYQIGAFLCQSAETFWQIQLLLSVCMLHNLAGVSTYVAWMTGNSIFDAIGSISVGCLLAATAVFLIQRNRQLLIGMSLVKQPGLLRKVTRVQSCIIGCRELTNIYSSCSCRAPCAMFSIVYGIYNILHTHILLNCRKFVLVL